MFKQHRLKFFAILALVAIFSVYYTFHSQAVGPRYWVGGCSTENWTCDDGGTTNWSSTSGGTNDASVPDSTNDVFFDANSGVGNSTISANINIGSLDMTGYVGTLTHNAITQLHVSGGTVSVIFSPDMTYVLGDPATSSIRFSGSIGTTTSFTTAGKIFGNIQKAGVSTVQLFDNLTTGSTATLQLVSGTFDANGQNVTIGKFESNNASIRSLLMGVGTWEIAGIDTVWDTNDSTNFTLDPSISILSFTDSSASNRNMNLGDVSGASTNNTTFYNFAISAGSGQFVIGSDASFPPIVNDLDFSGFTGEFSASEVNINGGLILGSGMTAVFVPRFTAASGIRTITSNGVSITGGAIFSGDGVTGATWVLQDAFSVPDGNIQLDLGELNTNDQNVTSLSFTSTPNIVIPSLTLLSGTWTLEGDGPFWLIDGTNGVPAIDTGTTHIILNNTNPASTACFLDNVSTAYNEVTLSGDNFSVDDVDGGCFGIGADGIFTTLNLNLAGGTNGVRFGANHIHSIDNFNTNGSAGNLVKISSDNPGFSFDFFKSSGIVSGDYLFLTDSHATGGATWYAGANSTDNGGNTGWIFAAAPVLTNKYWVGGCSTTDWDCDDLGATNWSYTSGGTNNATIPSATDDVYFDANSNGVGGSTINQNFEIKTLDTTGYTDILLHNFDPVLRSLTINGDLFKLTSAMTFTAFDGNAQIFFTSTTGTSSTPTTIETGGQNLGSVLISGAGGYFQLQDDILVDVDAASVFQIDAGTFDANGFNVTALVFYSESGLARTITMGNGTWTITGNDGPVWSTNIATNLILNRGNPVIFNYSGGIGTRIITANISGSTEANSFDFSFTGGTDIINMVNNSKVHDLDFTGFSGSLFNGTGINARTRTIYGDLTISTGMTLTAGTGTTTFAGTSGTQVITSNSKNFDFPLTFNGLGGAFQLADNLSSGTSTTRNMALTAGTLDLNGNTFSIFGAANIGTGSLVRSINFAGGTLELTGAFSHTSGSNFTTIGTGTIKIMKTVASPPGTFTGNGASYPTLWFTNTAAGGLINLAGSNTFKSIKINDTNGQSIKFLNGTTTTIETAAGWDINGVPGNLITIDSTSVGSAHTISVASGVVSSDYLNISNSIATGGAFFYAGANSIDGGGNSGWIFTAPDTDLPDLVTIEIDSTDANGYAQVGDTITIFFVADEPIQIPVTTIFSGGNPVTGIINTLNPSANEWEVTYVVEATDTEGLVTFAIDYSDLIGNPGVTGTTTTDATSVTIGEVPVVVPVTSGNIYGYRIPTYSAPVISTSATSTSITTFTQTYVENYINTFASNTSLAIQNAIRAIFGLPEISTSSGFQFTQDLSIGDVSEDVRELQKFLNAHGFIVSTEGFGSIGHEVLTFGPKTEQAVIKFQIANNITPAVGYFGPITRALVNSLI